MAKATPVTSIRTEEQIIAQHNQTATFIGTKLYTTALPALEIMDALFAMLSLNREMGALKQRQQQEQAKKAANK